MSIYEIGITEAGDAGIDLTWENKLDSVDGAVLITKNITEQFQEAVIRNKEKLIVHATVTGYGGTVLEPNVPNVETTIARLNSLIDKGFPKNKIVIRIDPILPTHKGITLAYEIMKFFMIAGFTRFRVSIIDMYPHVRKRFRDLNLPSVYKDDGFSPSEKQIEAVNSLVLRKAKDFWDVWKTYSMYKTLRIESCAEPGLTEAIQCGCISDYDLNLLGLHDDEFDSVGYQRKNCLCYSGKTELLEHKNRCPHNCLYCYWKD